MKYFEVRNTPVLTLLEFEDDASNSELLARHDDLLSQDNALGRISTNFLEEPRLRVRLRPSALVTNAARTGRQLMNCKFALDLRYEELLRTFKLTSIRFHPLEVVDATAAYSLFQCPPLLLNAIDFRRSSFFTGSTISGRTFHPIEGESDYRAMLAAPGGATLKPDYVGLVPEVVDAAFDVLPLRFGRIFFSEKLVAAVDRERLTGLRFIEASDAADLSRLRFAQ